ncbi:hypothetical protein KM043_016851 [Ampulex compressa]|nr:hypothetical protein KM043_016851 [Ampulex compressa]
MVSGNGAYCGSTLDVAGNVEKNAIFIVKSSIARLASRGRPGVPVATERNFSASLPIIVSSIGRTPQFLHTGSRPATKSVCGRENVDDYRDADGLRPNPGANLSPTLDLTMPKDTACFSDTP